MKRFNANNDRFLMKIHRLKEDVERLNQAVATSVISIGEKLDTVENRVGQLEQNIEKKRSK